MFEHVLFSSLCVIVSVLASSALDWGLYMGQFNPKTIHLLYLLLLCEVCSIQGVGANFKNGWIRMRIMCLSGATCLPADSCFHELALKKIQLSMLFQYNLSPMITWLYAVNYNHCRLLDFYIVIIFSRTNGPN